MNKFLKITDLECICPWCLIVSAALCFVLSAAAAAAKLLQPCPTLCNPIDGSPPGSSVPGLPQARILEWVAISFCMFCLRGTYVHSWVASLVICSSVNIYWAPVTCQVLWCLGYIKEQNRPSCNAYWQKHFFFFQLILTNVFEGASLKAQQ